MRIENLFIKRTKELPADATTNGHKLALKGGYVHQTGAGLYTYSAIGFKVLQNIEKIIRQELNVIGCQEINMPVVSPLSLWKETGRENIDILLKFKTRAGIESVVNPTHEEIVTDYVRSILQSYKQLPLSPNSLCLYQIQTKYRDELRARAGLIRCREFMMKDAYSFHINEEDLNKFYEIVKNCYMQIYNKLGLKDVIIAEAPGGDMGGALSHEYQMISDSGEDTIYTCEKCNVSFNKEILEGKSETNCPYCGGKLYSRRGIEVGNIFKLGNKYTKAMNVSYSDANGEKQTPIMGCYGIGVSRVFGCLLEQAGTDTKAVFNMAIAPYKIHIIAIGEGKSVELADKLYEKLLADNIDVIIDTTDDRAGSKFANADLIGAPIRVIISPKNIDAGVFEMKYSGLSKEYPSTLNIEKIYEGIKDILEQEPCK